ncbi:MAG: lysylphosphatidylglycerol synthase transmembrane domain-containing protein [Candidatus Pacebacteria bacterium]|nr:lysylphosphatidylglycerol synthase transmembrane domain-containing protein [Candidatus Paceibacterota bacterium]
MKKAFFLFFSILLGVLLLVSAFGQVDISEIKVALSLFSKEAFLGVFLLNFLAVFVVGTCRWQVILEGQGCPISFWKVMRAKMAGFTLSYITPSAMIGGEPVRAYMVKEESECGWERSFASVIIDQVIFLSCLFVAMVAGFIFLAEHFSLPTEVFYAFFLIFLSAFFILYFFYKKMLNRGAGEKAFFTFFIHKIGLDKIGFIKNKSDSIDRTEKSMENFFNEKKKHFFLAVFLGLLESFLDVLIVAVICFYLGQQIGILKSLGVFFFLTLANFFPIPGALGSFEFALTFASGILGIGKDVGLAFSLISRLINIILCLLGGVAMLHFSVKTVSHHFSLEAPPVLLKIHSSFSGLLRKSRK